MRGRVRGWFGRRKRNEWVRDGLGAGEYLYSSEIRGLNAIAGQSIYGSSSRRFLVVVVVAAIVAVSLSLSLSLAKERFDKQTAHTRRKSEACLWAAASKWQRKLPQAAKTGERPSSTSRRNRRIVTGKGTVLLLQKVKGFLRRCCCCCCFFLVPCIRATEGCHVVCSTCRCSTAPALSGDPSQQRRTDPTARQKRRAAVPLFTTLHWVGRR